MYNEEFKVEFETVLEERRKKEEEGEEEEEDITEHIHIVVNDREVIEGSPQKVGIGK
jgi:hypothetical protein